MFSVTQSETNVVWFPNYVRSCYRFNMYNYGLLLIKLNRVICCVNVLLTKFDWVNCCVNVLLIKFNRITCCVIK